MDLQELRNRFENLRDNMHDVIGDSLEAKKEDLAEFQRSQMLHGLDSEGNLIGKYKNPAYQRKKANMNPFGTMTIDLRLHGPFQREIKPIVMKDAVILTSTDEKTDKLTERFGERIWHLNPEFASEFSLIFLGPDINQRIQNKLHGRV